MLKKCGFARAIWSAECHDLIFEYIKTHVMDTNASIWISMACAVDMDQLPHRINGRAVRGMGIAANDGH